MDFVGFDKLSLLDYEDKIACVLFCKPCNFRCPFCHNGSTVLNANTYVNWEEIVSYLKSRIGVIDAVVFSGGEPTLMPDLKEKIIEIKKLGFLIKLDTNGSNPNVLKDLVKDNLLDYVAMDIKNSKDKYPETIGCLNIDFSNIMESIHFLINGKIPYEFRTTLVEEFHTEEDIKNIGVLIKGAEKMYLQKFIERESCIKKGLHEIPMEKANIFKSILENYVKKIYLRGY